MESLQTNFNIHDSYNKNASLTFEDLDNCDFNLEASEVEHLNFINALADNTVSMDVRLHDNEEGDELLNIGSSGQLRKMTL